MNKFLSNNIIFTNIEVKPSPDGRYQDCWIWKGKLSNKNYGLYYCPIDKKYFKTHRLSAFYSELIDPDGNLFTLDSKYKVLHKCDNPPCANYHHLFIGTNKDNTKDMMNKNRQNKGETNAHSKLTEQDVIEIRDSFNRKLFTVIELAKMYQVNRLCIYQIINKNSWKHI